jgi:hypothetical protein
VHSASADVSSLAGLVFRPAEPLPLAQETCEGSHDGSLGPPTLARSRRRTAAPRRRDRRCQILARRRRMEACHGCSCSLPYRPEGSQRPARSTLTTYRIAYMRGMRCRVTADCVRSDGLSSVGCPRFPTRADTGSRRSRALPRDDRRLARLSHPGQPQPAQLLVAMKLGDALWTASRSCSIFSTGTCRARSPDRRDPTTPAGVDP